MKIIKGGLLLALLGLILPVSNLFLFHGTPFSQYSQGAPQAVAIKPILEKNV